MPVRHRNINMKLDYVKRRMRQSLSVLRVACAVLVCLVFGATWLSAQDETDIMYGDIPLENAIVGHELAVRIRGEVLFTDDDESLLDDEVAYKQFPSAIYDSEIRIFQTDGLSIGASYGRWESRQDYDTQRADVTARAPWGEKAKVTWRYRKLTKSSDEPDRNYMYLGVSRTFGEYLYSYSQYRHTSLAGTFANHQLSQYFSITSMERYRLGGKGAVTLDAEGGNASAWYVDAFGVIYLWEQSTSLRAAGRHYETDGDLTFDEGKLYLYHSLTAGVLLRGDLRYYRDSDGNQSSAYGAKAKYFLSAASAVHVGYRFYDHKTSSDLDTLYAGISILL
jgi:hypothetical protein